MTTHTPGPWKTYIGATPELGCHVIRDNQKGARDGDIASMIGRNHQKNAANARLIAAAPTMKAIVERIAELTTDAFTEDDLKRNLAEIGADARAVLAMVEGKQWKHSHSCEKNFGVSDDDHESLVEKELNAAVAKAKGDA